MTEFFPSISKITYEGPKSKNPLAFKYYDPEKIVAGKPMKESLKFAMSYWHTLCGEGVDMFGAGTADKSFGGSDEMGIYRNKVYAGFELMHKLGIEYFCFHDKDIAPEGRTLQEFYTNLDSIVPLIKEQMKKYDIKLLWGTANCFNHPRYVHGAGTSCNADVFAYAAGQIRKALDITMELGGKGYVFWGGREGYETLLNTNMALEQDNMARLMRMAVEYARSKGYTGDFYIEPKPKEPTKHQYDFDSATVLGFLRKYGLDKDFKLNIEANHATLAAHTFQHELCTARINGAFGSIDANQGDPLLGWDTDQFPTNVYDAALCMLEVLKAGGFTNGGLNFDAKARRASMNADDLFLSYIAGMDTFALGLEVADALLQDGRLDEFVKQRYASYQSGIGQAIVNGETSLEQLADYALSLGEVQDHNSGRQEYLEAVVNSVMFRR
ncbi:xylose isomerase [Ructibacterium gallinarum]|uniref:Xylose isomerase n=1 Tax=Ructibacterium gallinarum TaxID=2779355 RepID=A0A9D5LX85_9FIRM|nr:xylose isomerase [Ructibacterium gallinarum]MBE5039511.1 xylose isomerase [Ructibacterium gallinarum]